MGTCYLAKSSISPSMLVCRVVCLFVSARSTGRNFARIVMKKFRDTGSWLYWTPIVFHYHSSIIEARKNHWKSGNPYLLTWGKFQKFITPSNPQVNLWNFTGTYISSISTDSINFVCIECEFSTLWRPKLTMGKPLYGTFRLTTQSILQIIVWNFTHM